jgi:prolyl-tRNA synthetase
MRQSHLRGKRLKEAPAEATLASHTFLLRGGYARQVAGGIYSLLHPGLRVARKIERIIREEMNRVGGQEVLMPVVLPESLWQESGRAATVGAELARFSDRTGQPLLLGMTHEEAVVHLFRNEVESYRDLPFLAYQIQTKFRDEPRSRGGLIRVREFTMKDAYSFHVDEADLEAWYERCRAAYVRIFARAGIPEAVVVASDSGMMGGAVAHEFMLLCDAGEDTIATCPACGYLANREVATGRVAGFPEPAATLEKVHTPGCATIEEVAGFLGVEPRQTAKAVFYHRDEADLPVLAVIRGDLEINEAKLARIIRAEPVIAGHDRVRAVGAEPGYASVLAVSPEKCRIVVDHSVAGSGNLVCGANEVDYHYRNFNLERDLPCETVDVAQVRGGDGCPRDGCDGALKLERGIEVGNIFQLGDKYTAAMGMSYLDEQGRARVPIMGCYGIGVGRLLAAVIEARHDAHGPIWPLSIAPWQVHLCALKLDEPDVAAAADALYGELEGAGVEVLFDDRNERPGVQFADADLLGIPFRLVVSPRNLKQRGVELLRRGERRGEIVPLAEAAAAVEAALAG